MHHIVNSNEYQSNETYIVDDKLHQYNNSAAKVGMRTRSIFIGAPTSVDGYCFDINQILQLAICLSTLSKHFTNYSILFSAWLFCTEYGQRRRNQLE